MFRCWLANPCRQASGRVIARRIHTRAPLEQNRRVRLGVYGIGVYVDHVIACGRRSRPRGRFMKRPPTMGLFSWCSLLCGRAAVQVFVCGGSARAMHIPRRVTWMVVSIHRIVSQSNQYIASQSLNPCYSRYDTIFRYDVSDASTQYSTLQSSRPAKMKPDLRYTLVLLCIRQPSAEVLFQPASSGLQVGGRYRYFCSCWYPLGI